MDTLLDTDFDIAKGYLTSVYPYVTVDNGFTFVSSVDLQQSGYQAGFAIGTKKYRRENRRFSDWKPEKIIFRFRTLLPGII